MGNIVGLGGSIHDFSACILQDRKIIAIEDERLTRIRYSPNSANPCRPALNYCLQALNLDMAEISNFAINDDLVDYDLPFLREPELVNHHLTHAISAFYTSTFDKAAILVIDGAGSKKSLGQSSEERETTTFAYGAGNSIKVLGKIYGDLDGYNPITKSQTVMTNSIGEFYRVVAETVDLGWLVGPGKLMGLSPYGLVNKELSFVYEMMSCITLLSNGKFQIRTNGKNGLIDILFQIRRQRRDTHEQFAIDAALANSAQTVFEILLKHSLDYLHSVLDTDNLCIVGGAALNSIANGKISAISKFKNIHVFFAPGDNGTSIGAAISSYLNTQQSTTDLIRFEMSPYLGRCYSIADIEAALKMTPLQYTSPDKLHVEVATLISNGKVIAWFNGASEFGPRALGNRSILADPRKAEIRDHINHKVKDREWYRPLAPAVLVSEVHKYFDAITPSNWMQFVWQVKEEFKDQIPSVTHIDGSARVQTVDQHDNPAFYKLIASFGEITGIPMLLNTSFNIKGEPIVETPEQAIQAFTESHIDALVLGPFLIIKKIS